MGSRLDGAVRSPLHSIALAARGTGQRRKI